MTFKILVPLDGSKIGEAALPYIEELVAKLTSDVKAEFILLQVVSFLTHYVAGGELMAPVSLTEQERKQIQRQARDYLNKVAKRVRRKKISAKVMLRVGNSAEEIIQAADEIGVDLIAMSTHGRHGLSRWAFGSVADKVLRGGRNPVLMVRIPKETA